MEAYFSEIHINRALKSNDDVSHLDVISDDTSRMDIDVSGTVVYCTEQLQQMSSCLSNWLFLLWLSVPLQLQVCACERGSQETIIKKKRKRKYLSLTIAVMLPFPKSVSHSVSVQSMWVHKSE